MKKVLLLLLILFVCLSSTAAMGEQPRREDIGDLTVLYLYGSYREMGRQQAELLGPDLQRVFEYQFADYKRFVANAGVGGWFFNHLLLPLYSGLAPMGEDSGLHEEIAGMASVLGVPSRDVMRALLSLSGGSTVFAATRSATADGRALIGRNVDWGDGFGRRRPLVAIYHPDGDDLDYIFVGWPLVGLPTVGVNEAGLAISLNFFESEPQVSLFFPAWPHRRALQKATTVEEAIQIIQASRRRGISAFLVLADASGDIAMVECTPGGSAVFRPDGDWFAHANHARTPEMIPYDRNRHPDSFQRKAAMEKAVQRHLGRLTPALAVEALRDREFPFANASNVANLSVLNPAVVHPASKTLWHSTTMQPHAPFGEYVPFTFDADANPPNIPASEALLNGSLDKEREEVKAARSVLQLHGAGELEQARDAWRALIESKPETLDLRRLALGYATTLDALGDTEGAYNALEQATDPTSLYQLRGVALVSQGILADRLGKRDLAKQHFEGALEHFALHPEFTVFAPMIAIAEDGLDRPQGKKSLPLHYNNNTRLPY